MEKTRKSPRQTALLALLKDRLERYKLEIVTGSPNRHNRQLNAELGHKRVWRSTKSE